MSSGLIKASTIAHHTLGTSDFFAAVRHDPELKRSRGRGYWSWPQWDHFFALAEKHGMTAMQTHQSGAGETHTMHYKPFGVALLNLWRRVQKAKEASLAEYLSASEFHDLEATQWQEQRQRLADMERYHHERRALNQQQKNEPAPRRSSAAREVAF